MRFEIKGDFLVGTHNYPPPNPPFTASWRIIVNNSGGVVASNGAAGIDKNGAGWAWGEIITINKSNLLFNWTSVPTEETVDTVHTGRCQPG
jgi:hypothetical protein